MATRIRVDLGNLEDAVTELREYADSLGEKAKQLCEELADIAFDTASEAYDSYIGQDTFAWVNKPEPTENGYMIEATGSKAYSKDGQQVGNMVTFVEFGSGDAAGDHPMASDFGVAPGTWSASEYGSNQYATEGQWTYNGVTYRQIPATMGMYNGAQEARRQLVQTAKEVFGGR